jgi:hypothetical protein
MVVFAVLFSLFQCLVMAILLVVAVANDAPDPWLTTPLIWLGILFGPAIYLFADNESNRPVINLVVAVLFVIAIGLGLTPGRFTLFPYYHQILSMGAIVCGLAIAAYNFAWPPGSSTIKHHILLGILALGPVVSATIWLTLLSGAIVAFNAAQAANGQSYCTLNYWTRLNGLGEYKQSRGVWDLEAYRMTSPFMSAGGSSSFQFGFHGLLLTPSDLFNWSYQSQRFETVTDTARRNLGIRALSCGP